MKEVSNEMRFCEIADAKHHAFCRTKLVSDDVWGSLSGGRLRNTLVCTGIILESAPQWNCQFSHILANVLARSSILICNSIPEDRSGNGSSSVVFGDVLACSSIVFCDSVSADRTGTDSSRVAEKSASKSSFFALASRSGFGAAISDAAARSSFVLCNSVCAAWRRGCVRNAIAFRNWTSQIVLEWLHQGCYNDLSADFLKLKACCVQKFRCKSFLMLLLCDKAPLCKSWLCKSFCVEQLSVNKSFPNSV